MVLRFVRHLRRSFGVFAAIIGAAVMGLAFVGAPAATAAPAHVATVGLTQSSTIVTNAGSSINSVTSEASDFITTYGFPAVAAMLVFGVLITLLINWTRKARKAST